MEKETPTLLELVKNLGFDDGLLQMMKNGIEKMPDEHIVKLRSNLIECQAKLPAILAETDALILKLSQK